jgi:hypothetical protein
MKIHQYGSIQELLDDLYENYLHSKFRPYTYGKDWVLVKKGRFAEQVAVPWSWLLCTDLQQYSLERDWASKTSPEQCGMTSEGHWYLATDTPGPRYGLAVNDGRYLPAWLRSPKVEYFLTQNGYLKYEDLSHVKPADFRFLFVLRGRSRFRSQDDIPANYALVQTAKPVPEEGIGFWL